MAFSIGAIGGIAYGWVSTIIFWCFILVCILGGLTMYLWLRKNRKLQYRCLEVIDIGGGKVGFVYHRAGWFKSKWLLGLFDYGGEEILMLKDKRKVQLASSQDFQELNGKRGLVVFRKSDDPKIVLPITNITLNEKSKTMVNAIAPADYRDASIQLIKQAEQETMSKFARMLPAIAIGFGVILLFLVVLFVIQYAKHAQAEAWKNTQEAIKLAYENRGAVMESVAPLIAPFMFWKKWKKN